MPDLEVKRREILALADGVSDLTLALAAKGIDARDPGDREAYDIICRIERRMAAHSLKPKGSQAA